MTDPMRMVHQTVAAAGLSLAASDYLTAYGKGVAIAYLAADPSDQDIAWLVFRQMVEEKVREAQFDSDWVIKQARNGEVQL